MHLFRVVTAAYLPSLLIVIPNTWTHIWACLNDGAPKWWCGQNEFTQACQSGTSAHFNDYTAGVVLRTPPVSSSPSSTAIDSSQMVTTALFAGPSSEATTVLASSLAKTSTGPPFAQTQEHSASLPIAIGVGVGIPLGVFGIGLLVFLFWKEAARQRRSQSQTLSQGTVLRKEDRSAAAAFEGGQSELSDTQLSGELEDTGKIELPSI